MRARLSLAAALALAVAAPLPAHAHPHVFIKAWSDVIFDDDGRITGVFVEWAFDEMYSEAAIDGLDSNGDGFYSDGELEVLTAEQIKALDEYRYFTYARVDGKDVPYRTVTDYAQILVGKTLKMSFRVPFAEPVDPKAGRFAYQIYDPDFYIAIEYAADTPVNVIGTLPEGCAVQLRDILADEKTEETREMLAGKGPDWQPETPQDFGAMFAQTVAVDCDRAKTN